VTTDLATLATFDAAALVAWGKERLDAAGSGLEVKKVKATAAAVAAYQRAVGAGKEAQQAAIEVTIRCERRLQQELKKFEKNKGGRPSKTVVDDTTVSDSPSRRSLGLDKTNVGKNAVLAEVTPEQFEAALDALRSRGELTMEAARSTIEQALAGGVDPDDIEAVVKRRREPEQVKLNIDLSPAGSAIFDLEVNNLWTFDPADCAVRVSPILRKRVLGRARVCRDWLDRFIARVEELMADGKARQAEPRGEEARVPGGGEGVLREEARRKGTVQRRPAR
jgi:hypothetical protein